MDINEVENCPKCSAAVYISNRKIAQKWACSNPNCGYSSDFLKAVICAKQLRWVRQKVVFDDQDRNIWMCGQLDGKTWLFRYINEVFVTYKEIELAGLNFTSGRQVEKIN